MEGGAKFCVGGLGLFGDESLALFGVLRGVTVGENAIIGTSAVLTADVPANAVVAGVPARVIRMRETPRTLRWG